MFNFYDRCESIDFKDSRNENWIHFPGGTEINDMEDRITISTEFVFDYIDRGWLGDITFNLIGYGADDDFNERTSFQKVKLRDVLCIRRTFNKHHDENAVWEYTFLKY